MCVIYARLRVWTRPRTFGLLKIRFQIDERNKVEDSAETNWGAVSCIIGFYYGSRWKLPPIPRKLPPLPRKLPPLPRKLLPLPWKRVEVSKRPPLPWKRAEVSTKALKVSMEAQEASTEASMEERGSFHGIFHNFHGRFFGSCVHENFHGSCGSFRGKPGVLPRKRFSQKLRAASTEDPIIASTQDLNVYFHGNSCELPLERWKLPWQWEKYMVVEYSV